MSILERLGFGRGDARAESGLIGAVRERLERLPLERAEIVATFAGLLARVAYADSTIDDAERASLRVELAKHSGLTPDEAEAVATIVVEHATDGIDFAALTRRLNEIAGEAQKEQLLDCLYAIATADDSASIVEEDAIRAVARALLLSHDQFIAIRLRYRDKLALLQGLRERRKP